MLKKDFYERDAVFVAKNLLGKVIYRKINNVWLKARIIETEAYYKSEKGSHSSQGLTKSRKAMFMPAGTIYMYYSRGKDSLNISVGDEGDAVLVKSGYPYLTGVNSEDKLIVDVMRSFYPQPDRDVNKLCSGQTLLCQALNLKVKDWNENQFDQDKFFIKDEGITVNNIKITPRLGIPEGRDEHLLYRFIDLDYIKYCTKSPYNKREYP